MRYVEIGGALAFVEEHGAGTPVMCLHTAGQSGVQWRHVAPALAARGYRVVVPDLPGHGRSEPALGGAVTDLRHYGDWCRTLTDVLGLRRPFVVGCSIGGKIALDLATKVSRDLSGVVAMAADAYSGGRPAVRGLQRELCDVASPSRTDRTELGTLAVVGRSVPRRRAELIATMHRREDPAVTTSDLIGWSTHDVRDRLASIGCPAHLVVGSDDLWVATDRVEAAAGLIPGARCTVLDGIGHYPMEEIEDFGSVLAGWLAELGGEVNQMTTPIEPHHVPLHPEPGPVPCDLPDLLRRLAERAPEAVAALDGGADPVSRAELWRRTRGLAADLREHGIGRGDCVAVWLPNWTDALVWQFAVAAGGRARHRGQHPLQRGGGTPCSAPGSTGAGGVGP